MASSRVSPEVDGQIQYDGRERCFARQELLRGGKTSNEQVATALKLFKGWIGLSFDTVGMWRL